VPLLPPLYLMAAHGTALLLGGLRKGRRPFLTVLIPVFLFALLVNSRGWGVGERRQEAPLYGELARALARSGETPAAVTELRTALSLVPSRRKDRYLLASLLIRQGDVDEDRLQLLRVLDEDPRHHRAWNSLGGLSLLEGNAEEAARYYRRALEIKPDYGLAARNLQEAERLRGP
jgi:tetratricopeptide (TPR) repeat protein